MRKNSIPNSTSRRSALTGHDESMNNLHDKNSQKSSQRECHKLSVDFAEKNKMALDVRMRRGANETEEFTTG